MSPEDAIPATGVNPLAALSDDALVALARGKNVPAFEELVGRHEEKIYRVAMRFVRNETDAQEILQETFLAAWRNLEKFEGKSQFASWLYRVAANAALMLLRSRKRHPQIAVEDVEPQAFDQAAKDAGAAFGGADWSERPDEQFQSGELRHQIEQAVESLPETQKSVF